MRQFEIFVSDRPGELAKVADVLGSNGINIMAIASERSETPVIRIVTNDEQSTRTALSKANFRFRENEALVVDLADRPGELAKMAKRLANAGINIDSIYILNKNATTTSVAIVVSDLKKAKEVLR
jgi:hypothetical protein